MSYELRQDPYALLEQARFHYKLRQVIFVVLLGLTAMFIWSHRDNLGLALDMSAPVDLGNARSHYLAKNMDLGAENGQYIKMEGLIPTRYRVGEGEGGSVYFTDYFCPIFNIAVRTREIPPPQPDFQGRQYLGGFPPEYIELIQRRRVHVENLQVHASVEGRIFRMDMAPAYVRDMVDYYERFLDRPVHQSWIVVDGLTPASVRYLLWVVLTFLGLDIVAVWWLLRLRRRLYFMAENLHQLADG